MNKWTIDAYTFVTEGEHYPYSVGFETENLDNDFLSANLTITADDTSKLVFKIPYMKGKDLYPGQTLVDVKYGDGSSWDRKFLGTVTKKAYENTSGVYTFEATGVLGTYQFMPNYDKYDGGTIESILATESSRFKGTALAPYADDNPWTLLYTGHNEIPSTFGDIETEEIGLIPAFNYSLQNVSANAYEFIKLITRSENYVIPTDVYPKSTFHLFEKGEKVYFKRVRQYNTQQVKYDVNLISYSYDRRTSTMKARAYNTVEGAYPSYGGYTMEKYPVPFNYRRFNLSPKSDNSAYTVNEIANECTRLAVNAGSVEAFAFDQHLIDDTIPWLEIDKYVSLVLFENGEEKTATMEVAQIYYDLVDSTKSKVKLGRISSWLTSKAEANEKDIDAELKNRLETSGGTMTGAIKYDNVDEDVETKNTIQDGNILLEYENNDSSPTLPYSKSASVEIMSNHENSQQPRIEMSNEYKMSTGSRTEWCYRNAIGEVASYTQKDANGNVTGTYTHNLAGSSLQLMSTDSNGVFRQATANVTGLSIKQDNNDICAYTPNKAQIRDRIFGTCNLIDMASLEQGGINGDGSEFNSSARVRTAYISVKGDTTYTISCNTVANPSAVRAYNSSKTVLTTYGNADTHSNKFTFTTSANTTYIRIIFINSTSATSNVSVSDISWMQLEKGSSASSYVPYAMDNVELTERCVPHKVYFTPSNCSSRDVFGGCFYEKVNGIVHLHIGANNPSSTSDLIVLGTMPVGYRPDGYACQIGHGGSAFGIAKLLVADTGQIRLATQGTDIVVDLFYKAKD